jgi:GNAT superfamily N-acetyltransferase
MEKIRTATPGDCTAIAALQQQLGYVIAPNDVQEKLSCQTNLDCIFVAELDNQIVACISLHALPLFHVKGYMGRITSLVVNELHRGKNIGSRLMEAADEWFRAKGCIKAEVTSGNHRADAHRFYGKNAYVVDGQRLSKILK